MLPDHVHAHALEQLEIVHHGLHSRREVDTIRPVALVQRAPLEDELAIQQGSLHAVDFCGRDGAEASVAADRVRTHGDGDIVEIWRFRRP